MLILNDISILKLSSLLLPLPSLYVTNLQNYHKFEVKIQYIWHQYLQFSPKTNALLTIFAASACSFHLQTRSIPYKIPLLHAHCTSYHYTNNLSHKQIGILFPIISHYFPLFPIISHYFPLFPTISHLAKKMSYLCIRKRTHRYLVHKTNLKTLMSNSQKQPLTLWELSTTTPPGEKSSTSSSPSLRP
mgnify:CR=1 FL=1